MKVTDLIKDGYYVMMDEGYEAIFQFNGIKNDKHLEKTYYITNWCVKPDWKLKNDTLMHIGRGFRKATQEEQAWLVSSIFNGIVTPRECLIINEPVYEIY